MWDERYSGQDFLFGTEPAAFLQAHAHLLAPGQRALAVADGEGRNSVFLGQKGLTITAMDGSPVGVAKARRLAAERGVAVDFHVADILKWDWVAETYDVVVAIFIQFLAPDERAPVFEGLKRTLRPGGLLLLHGYRPEQLDYRTGGPPWAEHMYTEALLRDAFSDMRIERLEAYDTVIEEGSGHKGMSALIDLVARKA
jgi:SAM-dependent methyltransferase